MAPNLAIRGTSTFSTLFHKETPSLRWVATTHLITPLQTHSTDRRQTLLPLKLQRQEISVIWEPNTLPIVTQNSVRHFAIKSLSIWWELTKRSIIAWNKRSLKIRTSRRTSPIVTSIVTSPMSHRPYIRMPLQINRPLWTSRASQTRRRSCSSCRATWYRQQLETGKRNLHHTNSMWSRNLNGMPIEA